MMLGEIVKADDGGLALYHENGRELARSTNARLLREYAAEIGVELAQDQGP